MLLFLLLLSGIAAFPAEQVKTTPADEETIAGPWQLTTHTSMLDDSKSQAIFSVATESERFWDRPLLLASCHPKGLILGISWHGEQAKVEQSELRSLIPEFVRLTLRFDKETPSWSMGSLAGPNLVAVVYEKPKKTILPHLGRTSTLTVGIPFISGETGVAVFQTGQFEEGLRLLGGACNFR